MLGWVILGLIIVVGVAINVFIFHRIHVKNTTALDIYSNALKIQPNKGRFFVSWLIFYTATSIPPYLVLWLLSEDKVLVYVLLGIFPIMLASIFYLEYPYYTVLLIDSKMNGASLWGWMWRRSEISLNEIDKEKVLQQNLFRILGITMFKSASGEKILTLGLDDLQIKQIIEHANKNT